jgi:hypothetical protein
MSTSPFDVIAAQLRALESKLRTWVDRPHRWPLPYERWMTLSKQADDLVRQADALTAERPYLIVMLMGGTGVGKSSLLNALAKGNIAEAAFTRPTTREPIVYLHRQYDAARLDPALRECRVVWHEQPGLEYKILVDTPDLDSNETKHRDRLEAVLPTADVVLYVGSQEKYHDQAGWELFLQQKERRAFAFVLNKWDRCLAASGTGLRPDQDLLRDLKAAGFLDPLIFRTCAYAWANGSTKRDLPEGEQFPALASWLEQGLTKREIEAIRTKGIQQLLNQLESALREAQPPDVQQAAGKTTGLWQRTLDDEIHTQTELLLNCVAVHQKTLERRMGQAITPPFRGMTGWVTRMLEIARNGLFRSRLPRLTTAVPAEIGTASGDLLGFARSCAKETYQRSLGARLTALTDRLVANADDGGLPTSGLDQDIIAQLASLSEPMFANYLGESLRAAEVALAGESSWRVRSGRLWTWLGDLVPWCTGLVIFLLLLYSKFVSNAYVGVTDLLLLPFFSALFMMVLLYVIYRWTVPVTWRKLVPAISAPLRKDLQASYATALKALPEQQATLLTEERRAVTELLQLVGQARQTIRQQEQLGQVAVLYAQ